MSEKHIDLLTPIIESEDIGSSVHYGVKLALNWLDDHPDQAPGRTITESELRERSHYMTDDERVTFMEGVSVVGGRVVPDPEPTNAEKLRYLLDVADKANMCHNLDKVAAWLDEAGVIVTPPGGDE